MYDIERGKVSIQDWGKHLLRYYDDRFLEDSLFGLFLYNIPFRDSPVVERETFFSLQTDLLEEIHQQFKNCKGN
jgi:hypothetical protein